ncbi:MULTISPECIES: PadR family transcriptional regulator [unclassified Nitrobacter]|uniref:PadR family transcriptional regulator n=1 Tax=unclassified Nitrobacter TaxID=2620411 RepID=UPI000926D1B4|nr:MULTISPECIES: PadR family transcriptional regulator [unclassified Nitrobacter]MBN9146623.1 PadR family transcriptional regulator [Nitrobacter sp.]OJV03116.1 MAG: PadR family transcriptional regulator [Nitrobacter sp. 62-23]
MTAPSSKGVAEDDLRLVALSLISETPRRGYEVIQTIEKMTADWFLPSPNKVHPMLASLVESGHLTASTDPPRLFTITDEGRAFLEQNHDRAAAVLGRLNALGERVTRWRQALGMAERIKEADADATEGLLDVLARAAMPRK